MPIDEAYQQAILNGVLDSLLTEAGGSFLMLLYDAGVEVTGNGYARQPISTVPRASAVNANGYATTSLETDTPFVGTGSGFSWSQIEIRDSSGTDVVFPKIRHFGSIAAGESRKVTAVFGINKPRRLSDPTEIQTAIDNDKQIGEQVELVADNIVITSAIVADGVSGGHIAGAAVSEANDQSSDLLGLATNFVWGGVRDGSEHMFRQERSDITVKQIGFMGATRAQIDVESVDKVDTIYLMRRSTNPIGIGTGKTNGEDLYFCYGKNGLVLGENLADGNCDESTWTRCFFDKMDNAVVMNNYQCLEHRFISPRFRLSDVCFRINAGGALTTIGGNMTHLGSFLYFPSGTSANFGQNSNSYLVEHLKVDSQATGSKVIDQYPIAGNGYYSDICLHKLHLPSPLISGVEKPYWHDSDGTDINDIDPIIMVSGSTHVHIEDCSTLQRGMIAWDAPGGFVSIEIDGGRIWWGNGGTAISAVEQLLNLSKSRGTAYVHIHGCRHSGSRTPYAAYEADAVGLLV